MTKIFSDEIYDRLSKCTPKSVRPEARLLELDGATQERVAELDGTLVKIYNDIDLRRAVLFYGAMIRFANYLKENTSYLGLHPQEWMCFHRNHRFEPLHLMEGKEVCVISNPHKFYSVARLLVHHDPKITGAKVLKSLEEEIRKIISS